VSLQSPHSHCHCCTQRGSTATVWLKYWLDSFPGRISIKPRYSAGGEGSVDQSGSCFSCCKPPITFLQRLLPFNCLACSQSHSCWLYYYKGKSPTLLAIKSWMSLIHLFVIRQTESHRTNVSYSVHPLELCVQDLAIETIQLNVVIVSHVTPCSFVK
jgi:hypothetical protein